MNKEFKKIIWPIAFIALLVILSSFLLYGLARMEGKDITLLKSLYMVAITISTIGYEDMIGTQGSRLLTVVNIALIFIYMIGVAYAVSNFTAFLIEGRLNKFFQLRKLHKRIKRMDKHYIICGAKDIGIYVARELKETKRPFIVIDENPHVLDAIRKEIPDVVAVLGDPTDDNVLLEAGIKKAQALIAALESDKENLYLVVAAKDLNNDIKIASRFNNPATRHKFVNAGASYLVSPNMIGGMRIASELVRPMTVSFLDTMLRSKKHDAMRVEEFQVPKNSGFIGKTLLDVHKETGVLAISAKRPDSDDYDYNPDPLMKLIADMVLIFIATPDKRIVLEEKLAGK